MRTLNKNATQMWYALYRTSEPIYKLDDHGNKIIVFVDESTTPPTTYYEKEGNTKEGFSAPVEFYGNIAFGKKSGDAETTEFGVSLAEYEADVTVSKDLLPIDETSLIWTHEPLVDSSGYAVESDADYKVLKVIPSLNVYKYLLAKVQK